MFESQVLIRGNVNPRKHILKIHVYILLVASGMVFNDLILYLYSQEKIDTIMRYGCEDSYDIPSLNVLNKEASISPYIHPRILFSNRYHGKTCEIWQLVPFSQKIDVNKAGKDLLMTLPGIGETRASRIIEYRLTHAPLSCLEDLRKIPGFHDSLLLRLRSYVRFADSQAE